MMVKKVKSLVDDGAEVHRRPDSKIFLSPLYYNVSFNCGFSLFDLMLGYLSTVLLNSGHCTQKVYWLLSLTT